MMNFEMFLAGFKFGNIKFHTNNNNRVLVKHCHSKDVQTELNKCERYDFGKRSIYYSYTASKAYVISNCDDSIDTFSTFAKRRNATEKRNILEINTSCLSNNILTFCVYYWLYSFYPRMVAIPGKIKRHKGLNDIEFTDSGDKVVIFDQGGHIFFHQFGYSQIIPFYQLNRFKYFGTDNLSEIVFQTGSRPFWYKTGMKNWIEFIDYLSQ